MNERKFDMNRDGLGILLFVAGILPAVLLVVALRKSEPLETMTGTGALAALWLAALGALPSLLLTVGIALLGARLYLFGKKENLLRNGLGLAGAALGLAILLGAFSATAGGRIGDATGGLVGSMTHAVVGAVFGLFAFAAPIWFTWFRAEREPRIAADPESGAGEVLGEEVDDGVSAEEARALIPEDFNRSVDEARKQGSPQPLRSAPPPSPYPEDVRLKGQIPVGARPLQSEHDVRTQPASANEPSSVYRWTAPRADVPADSVDEDLAVAADAEVIFDAEPVAGEDDFGVEPIIGEAPWSEPLDIAAIAPPENLGVVERDVETLAAGLELTEATAELAAVAGIADATAAPLHSLPRPSWEQSSMFTEVDEPVDAYGTPLTLVEALRQENDATRARGAAASDAEELAPAPADPAQVAPTETDFAPELTAGGEDETEIELATTATPMTPMRIDPMDVGDVGDVGDLEEQDLVDEDGDEFEDVESLEVEEDEEESADEEDEESEELDEEEDLEFVAEANGTEVVAATEAEEEEEEEEQEDELAESAEVDPDSDDDADLEDEDETEEEDDLQDEAVVQETEKEEAPEAQPVVAERPSGKVAAPIVEGTLLDLMEKRAPEPKPAAPDRRATPAATSTRSAPPAVHAGARDSGAREREIVLQPRAVAPEKSIKTQAAIPERAELLREAGCLFVDRGRVAVSMLQRQYGMDFDQACEILDELQNLGLIGPYLGGQRRDILLTREQWLEKVGAA